MSSVENRDDLHSPQGCDPGICTATAPRAGRLIVSPPGGGAMNMAIDAALLAGATPDRGPTLRFYRWSEPTLSLGYFQSIANRSEHVASGHLAVVRRASGGGAIIHDHELTYSLILPTDDKSVRGAASDIYRAVHAAFIECLAGFDVSAQRFGDTGRAAKPEEPFLCFQRRNDEDLVVSGYKVLGSAQRRGPAGLLQHGSLLLAASEASPELPGIRELTSRTIDVDRLVDQLSAKLAVICGVQWSVGGLTFGEMSACRPLLEEKFSAKDWTERR